MVARARDSRNSHGRTNRHSQSHLSFSNLGARPKPRDGFDRLATALDIPLGSTSIAVAAGFAPEWRQRDLAAQGHGEVASALDYMRRNTSPYPAVVVDRHGELLRAMRVLFAGRVLRTHARGHPSLAMRGCTKRLRPNLRIGRRSCAFQLEREADARRMAYRDEGYARTA